MTRRFKPGFFARVAVALFTLFASSALADAQNTNFHGAPDSVKQMKNPMQGQQNAEAGAQLYAQRCSRCHGRNAEGSGNIPALVDGVLESVSDGEVFWFITNGDHKNGMPSFAYLPDQQRWQVVTYVKWLGLSQTVPTDGGGSEPAPVSRSKLNAPPPTPPFTDFRYEQPGKTRKITVNDLPQPYATSSAENGPDVVPRPADAWPKAPAGFKVEQYATGLDQPRLMRTAPNGDIFLAEKAGRIRIFPA